MSLPSSIPLRVNSDFSLGIGASKTSVYAARAVELGYPAIALTDRNNMHGSLVWSNYAAEKGVQPIHGAVLYMDIGGKDSEGDILLLAQTEKGFENLCYLIEAAHAPTKGDDGEWVAPDRVCVSSDALAAHSEGLILLTGGRDGVLTKLLRQGREEDAQGLFYWLAQLFGDRLYVEISRGDRRAQDEEVIESALIALADGFLGPISTTSGEIERFPIVATAEARYSSPDNHLTYEMHRAISEKRSVIVGSEEAEKALRDAERFHIRTPEEMEALFADLPDALENSVVIARRCAYRMMKRAPILPPFPCEDGRTEEEELRSQAHAGLTMRFAQLSIPEDQHQTYRDRLDFELDTIVSMKFPGYFLIVSDFIKWAKSQNIPVGPGRGSGAGSLVAFALTITDLDPIPFGLLFERFLNPERVSMPDFDIDFCQDRRAEVIQYVQRRYGMDRVSMIATFGKIKSKTALKDTQRALLHEEHGAFSWSAVNEITKLIPNKPGGADPMSLKEALENEPAIQERVEADPKLKVLWNEAQRIEGLYKSTGSHAAGVLIGDRPLAALVPVSYDPKMQMPVCQLDMKYAEMAGLVKFDFLGLTTLSVRQLALHYIHLRHGLDIDPATIRVDDAAVYENIFAKGSTNGLFQFESGGMKKYLIDMLCDRFTDLIAMNALYRPGPMDNIPKYIRVKLGLEKPDYMHPALEPILKETYGIMVYQEQVMQVAQVLAGYTLGGADLLRRAMGKKIKEEMEKERAKFIKGAKEKMGVGSEQSGMIFDQVNKFAGYGFNKSHAAAYALLAYQTGWLKWHYPAEFFSAMLSYEDDPARMALVKDDMDDRGVPLLRPCVNNSDVRFMPEDQPDGTVAVRFGLKAVKSISADVAQSIASERSKGGTFASIEDFHARMVGKINKKQMATLVEAGALDSVLPKDGMGVVNRHAGVNALEFLEKASKERKKNQDDLFGSQIQIPRSVMNVAEWGDWIDREFKSIGFYFNAHPIDPYVDRLKLAGVRRRVSIQGFMQERRLANLSGRRICVMVDKVFRRTSQSSGSPYLSVEVSEKHDSFRMQFFNRRGGTDINDIQKILEGAMKSRVPAVLLCDCGMDDDEGKDMRLFGRDAWTVHEFLANVRGDMVMKVEPGRIVPTRPESRRLAQINEDLAKDAITAADAERLTAEIMDEMLQRRLNDIHEALNPHQSDQGSKIIIQVAGDAERTIHLPFRVRVTPVVENIFKTMDGITEVWEKVARNADGQPVRQPAPSSQPAPSNVTPFRSKAPANEQHRTESDEDERPQVYDEVAAAAPRRVTSRGGGFGRRTEG